MTGAAHPQSVHSRRAVLTPQPSEVGGERFRPIEEGNHGRSHHSSTRDPEQHRASPARRRRRPVWLLALLAAFAASTVAGIAVAEQLTRSSAVAPTGRHGPNADTRESPTTGDRGSSSAPRQAVAEPRQEYLRRPAYVRGRIVLIRIRADAANVREDRGISK
jgi:hypothetical protein